MKTYYGINHHRGIFNTSDVSVFAFYSREERDEWVERGNPYVTNAGHRVAARASNPMVRRALRRRSLNGGDPYQLQTEYWDPMGYRYNVPF